MKILVDIDRYFLSDLFFSVSLMINFIGLYCTFFQYESYLKLHKFLNNVYIILHLPFQSVSECIILKKLGMSSFVIVRSLFHSKFISISYVQQLFCLLFMQMLVRTLHTCSVKFPDVAVSIVPLVSVHFVMTGNLKIGRASCRERV